MGRRGHHSAAKRQRDRAKQEKKARKRQRKAMRDDRDGLTTDTMAAPPKKGGTDEEVRQAIERAMNPGKVRARMSRNNGGGGSRLFVGNLDFDATEHDLKTLFTNAGYTVVDARIVTDRQTGESRGFAFVGLSGDDDPRAAISDLDGAELNGRPLRVNPADQKRR
jgi:RNA recognition motif-containing protein